MKAKKVLSGALAAILLTLTPGVAVCAEEDGRAGADGKYTSTVCTGAGKPGKSSILCGENRYKTRFRTGHRDPRSMRLPAL